MHKGDTSHIDRVEPWRGLAGQVEGFEEVEEHCLVISAVHQIRRIGSDESTSTIFRSALWGNDWEGQVFGLGASEMSSSCASSRSHCSSSPSSKRTLSLLLCTFLLTSCLLGTFVLVLFVGGRRLCGIVRVDQPQLSWQPFSPYGVGCFRMPNQRRQRCLRPQN
jgi:hypothetical protein